MVDNLIEIWKGKFISFSNNLKKMEGRHKNSKSTASNLKVLCVNLSPATILISHFC